MHVYDRLGMTPVINAASTLTKLGGSTLPEPVVTAMAEASERLVDIVELGEAVGAQLARLTRNEAAHVTAGGAAGLVLGILAFRTHGRPEQIARLPHDPALPDEILMYCAHRNPYDHAVLLAGATIRQVGSVKQVLAHELEAAIGPRTAGLLFVAGPDYARGGLSLEETVQIAASHDVPVIVDAAAQVPPVENLWHYTAEAGADLAVFSGGKQLRGPQASGLVVGRARWVEALRANAAPHQRFARAMKAGKEEIVGLLVAVEHFLAQDHEARLTELLAVCEVWAATARAAGLTASVEPRNAGGARLPRVRLTVPDAHAVEQALWARRPRIAVLTWDAHTLLLEPEQVRPEDAALLIGSVLDAVHDV